MSGIHQDAVGRWLTDDGRMLRDGGQWVPVPDPPVETTVLGPPIPQQPAGPSPMLVQPSIGTASGAGFEPQSGAPFPASPAVSAWGPVGPDPVTSTPFPQSASHLSAGLSGAVSAPDFGEVPLTETGRWHLNEVVRKSAFKSGLLLGAGTYGYLVGVGFALFILPGLLALVWCWPLVILLFPVGVVWRLRRRSRARQDLAGGMALRIPVWRIGEFSDGVPTRVVTPDRTIKVRWDDEDFLKYVLQRNQLQNATLLQDKIGAVDIAPRCGCIVGVTDKQGRLLS